MIFNKKEDLDRYAHEKVYETCEQTYFIMRTGYSMIELLNDAFSMEVAAPYFGSGEKEDSILWFDDWYEGQNFIEVYDYYHEGELLHKLQHTQHKDGLEYYVSD